MQDLDIRGERERQKQALDTARTGVTWEERDTAVRELVELGYCTHYPGYTCDRDFPEACPACIKRCINLQKARERKAEG